MKVDLGDSKSHDDFVKRLMDERRAADTEMAKRLASILMPEDIRSRAKSWRMEAFCEVLWSAAFQAGWRERAKATHAAACPPRPRLGAAPRGG